MKSIINVRRSSICWRGRRELITDVRKPEIMVMTRHCRRGELFTDYSDHPQTCQPLNPKLKSQAPDVSLSCWWTPTASSLACKDFSPESQDAVALQQIKECGALPMIDRGDIRQAIDRCSKYLGFTAGRWLWSVRAWGRQPDCKNSKKWA